MVSIRISRPRLEDVRSVGCRALIFFKLVISCDPGASGSTNMESKAPNSSIKFLMAILVRVASSFVLELTGIRYRDTHG